MKTSVLQSIEEWTGHREKTNLFYDLKKSIRKHRLAKAIKRRRKITAQKP